MKNQISYATINKQDSIFIQANSTPGQLNTTNDTPKTLE